MSYNKFKGFANNMHLPHKQNPSPNYKQYPQGMTDKLPGSA